MADTAPLLEVRLLGLLLVQRRDSTVVDDADWGGGDTQDLLRVLALHGGRPMRTEGLAGLLWPALSAQEGGRRLGGAVRRLRGVINGDCVVRGRGTVRLVNAWVDVSVVRGLLAAGAEDVAAGRDDLVVSRVRSLERLYRGDFHAHDDDSDWATAERVSLARGRIELLGHAAEICLSRGDHREALLYANAMVFAAPTVEVAHRLKMQAHAELGEPDLALRTFERFRQFTDDQGVEPAPETRELHRLIRDA